MTLVATTINIHNLEFKSFSENEVMAVTIKLRKNASLRFDGISSKCIITNFRLHFKTMIIYLMILN